MEYPKLRRSVWVPLATSTVEGNRLLKKVVALELEGMAGNGQDSPYIPGPDLLVWPKMKRKGASRRSGLADGHCAAAPLLVGGSPYTNGTAMSDLG
jgi:ATP-dependent DNA ligase